MRSKAPAAATECSAAAVAIGPASTPGAVSTSTAADAPSARHARSCSSASTGPSDTTVTEPPNRSTSRTASSTAHSSCGLMVNPDALVSMARESAVSVIAPPTVGTRLTQTRISMAAFTASATPAGSNTAPWDATVTGYGSPMYSTSSGVPDRGQVGRQVRHQQVPADRRARPGRGHVRRPPERVHQARAVQGQDRLAAEHVPGGAVG